MTSRKDRIWLRLGLAGSKARYGREPVKRAPARRWESSLQVMEVASPPVSEDEEPVEVPEFTVEDLSSNPSREEAKKESREETVRDEVVVEASEFSLSELRFLSSREEAEEGSSKDGVGAEPGRKDSGKWSVKKTSIFLFFFMMSLIGSVSVVGLLQPRESVGSSGFVVQILFRLFLLCLVIILLSIRLISKSTLRSRGIMIGNPFRPGRSRLSTILVSLNPARSRNKRRLLRYFQGG